jgi:hypothetical protein
MRAFANRLSYANVVSTLALFLVLSGGVALARQFARHSVGAPQLKSSAVTTAKIKANAVTTRKLKRFAVSDDKLKDGAVTTEKLFNGAVTTEKLDLHDVPFTRVSERLRGGSVMPLEEEFQIYPLSGSAYTQAAEELDSYAGEIRVTIPAKCTPPRTVNAYVLVNPKDPTKPAESEIVAMADFEDSGSAGLNQTIELQPNPKRSLIFEPGTASQQTVDLVAAATCSSGSGVIAS